MGIDGSNLPPCSAVLYNKLRRSNLVSWMWRISTIPSIEFDPTDHGWKLGEDQEYEINWFYGPEAPDSIDAILLEMNLNTSDEENEDMFHDVENDE